MEKGLIRPSPATAASLALALGLPREFFTLDRRGTGEATPAGTHFRSLRSTSARDRNAAWAWSQIVLDVADALQAWVELPDIAIPSHPLESAATAADIARAVDAVRAAWQLPAGPVGNLVRHLEAHGVIVARARLSTARIDAFSNNQARRPVVVLGTNKADAAHGRFDVAHELGHLVGHPEADPGGGHEQQAHAFAAELLMPADQITAELPRRFDLGGYGRLKHRWGVSIQALLYRARTLNVITDAAYRRALVAIEATHGRTDEPFPLPQPERPVLLAQAFQLASEQGASLDLIAGRTGLPRQLVEDIVTNTMPPRVDLSEADHP